MSSTEAIPPAAMTGTLTSRSIRSTAATFGPQSIPSRSMSV